MSIKLICFEPWNGRNISKYDSGFGDRVAHWLLAYYLSTLIEDLQIIVEEKYWPELLLLDFPNTISQDIDLLELTDDQLIPISFEKFKNILLNDKNPNLNFSENFYYYIDFSLYLKEKLEPYFRKRKTTYNQIMHEAAPKIKLKLKEASDFMKKEFSESCCIHLRRGLGTFPTMKFLNEIEKLIPIELLNSYWEIFHRKKLGESFSSMEYKYHNSLLEKDDNSEKKVFLTEKHLFDFNWTNSYKIIPDSDYFNLIDNKILLENPNQKIYISSDIPKKYYSYYQDRYPNNIMDKTFYFRKFLNLYKDKLPPEKLRRTYSISIFKTFENVFDLIVACHSKILVKSTSNWSYMSSFYKNKKVIHAARIVSSDSLGSWES